MRRSGRSPSTTYTRSVTDDEVLEAGFPRRRCADLFGEAGRARVELVFRTRPSPSSAPPEDWALWFVDARASAGSVTVATTSTETASATTDTALVLVGMWTGGFHYVPLLGARGGLAGVRADPEDPDA